MPKENLLTRDLYRKIKSMNRVEMEKTINRLNSFIKESAAEPKE